MASHAVRRGVVVGLRVVALAQAPGCRPGTVGLGWDTVAGFPSPPVRALVEEVAGPSLAVRPLGPAVVQVEDWAEGSPGPLGGAGEQLGHVGLASPGPRGRGGGPLPGALVAPGAPGSFAAVLAPAAAAAAAAAAVGLILAAVAAPLALGGGLLLLLLPPPELLSWASVWPRSGSPVNPAAVQASLASCRQFT